MVGYIKNVTLQISNFGDEREVIVVLSCGCVKICACYESYEQYHATLDEKRVTVGIADIVNDWLHGDEHEPWSEIKAEVVAMNSEWIKENASEVFGRIDDFELRRELAMSQMDKMRSPLRHVDSSLYNAMHDALQEWCEENGFNVDDYDVEGLVF